LPWRELILQPKIILYDEPTTGLDPITAKEILILMKSIQEKYNTSALIITHDVDCARVISNRMILLVDGINYAEGTLNYRLQQIQKCKLSLNKYRHEKNNITKRLGLL
jgi:ABC-type transporter Mla maintaining outer membrane lipid asymmetry ATPase subunit MlaF